MVDKLTTQRSANSVAITPQNCVTSIKLAMDLGMANLAELCIDGTRILGNANRYKTWTTERLTAITMCFVPHRAHKRCLQFQIHSDPLNSPKLDYTRNALNQQPASRPVSSNRRVRLQPLIFQGGSLFYCSIRTEPKTASVVLQLGFPPGFHTKPPALL